MRERELDSIPDHDHEGLPREFVSKSIEDYRTADKIAVDFVYSEAMQYAQAMVDSRQPINADSAWDYAKDAYEYYLSIGEIPYLKGQLMSMHMYQAHFMLAFEAEHTLTRYVAEQGNLDIANFMEEANQLALNELTNS